jgi:4-hydroxy-3-methylbut-2-enyl diphosphate reductase
MMQVILSAPRGFCAGVVRAIDIVDLCLEHFGSPIYVRHEIVHNKYVVDSLRKKGAIFIEEIEEVPHKQTVIFSAHGVAPSVWKQAQERELRVLDATCPLVTKVHIEALKYARDGYYIIVVGHEGHPEVVGTMGEVPDRTYLVGSVAEAKILKVADPDHLVALTQTTLSVEDTNEVIDILRRRFPKLITRNDICYATTNRQSAVKALARQVDVVLVIGAQNSSNCNRLREVAQDHGVPSYLINGPDELDKTWIHGMQKIGITSGASTPEDLVDAVISFLEPDDVSTMNIIEENVSFALPRELRGIELPAKKAAIQST